MINDAMTSECRMTNEQHSPRSIERDTAALPPRREAGRDSSSCIGHWSFGFGHSLVIGHWSLVIYFWLLVLTGCSRQATAAKERHLEATPVMIVTVTNVAWDKVVSIVGTLYPKDEATIGAQVEGSVEQTLVDFGDRVQTNQDLAFIDTGSYEAQLEQAIGNLAKADANLTNARKNFARIAELRKGSVASESDYDQAQAVLDQWEAEVKAARGAVSVARLNLDRSKVRAPFDGAIAQRIVGRGDFVKVGSPLFTMVNDAVLKFIFQVPERYGSQVRKKLPVSFNVDNYPGETFTGSVYLISPSVSPSSRAFGVGALVTNRSEERRV